METAAPLPVANRTWPPGTRHYLLGGGGFILVEVDDDGPSPAMEAYAEQAAEETGELLPRPMNFLKRHTVILPAQYEGFATSLEPLFRFDPGVSHADALRLAGFELVDAPIIGADPPPTET